MPTIASSTPSSAASRHSVMKRVLGIVTAVIVVLALVILFFPWDLMRGPINRYVSDQLGRRFEITQHLSVHLGRTVTVHADGLELANPEWAREPYLVKAKAAEFDIRLWPLLFGKVELPRIALIEPQVGLQLEPDGRRTWALSRDTANTGAAPLIGALTVDKGLLSYRAAAQGADMMAEFSLAAEGTTPASSPTLPLAYKVSGKWRNAPFSANGRAGGVLQLSKDFRAAFPIEVDAVSGKTRLKARGTIENLQELSGLDASFDIQGHNLEELYQLAGVVLPSTPPYRLRGRLDKQGGLWSARQIQGVLGSSDLSGELSFDTTAAIPLLTGKVQSKLMDFEDLRPVIGLPVRGTVSSKGSKTTVVSGAPVAQAIAKPAAKPVTVTKADPSRKVLPKATLDLVRLQSMNADVVYSAASIRHVEELPLDKGSVHVKLNKGVLVLDPLVLGVAGGSLAGKFSVDTNVAPAAFDAHLALRAVQLNKLFPTIEKTKTALGKISGQVNLSGRGNSAAQMLGSASGDVAVLMGKGELSNILLEFMGLDGGEVIKFLVRGDRNVKLLCSAAAFEVKQGLMSSKVIVLDTSDTVINGAGQISLANETLDITLNPQPKDRSILSFRSPLRIGGTFASPSAGPDKAALGARAGLTLGLALINPLLALAATIETGPGQDADCRNALAVATDRKAKAQPEAGNPASAASSPAASIAPLTRAPAIKASAPAVQGVN